MLRLIFKYVIPLALMLAVFLVGYNYYWGNADEKEKSQQIIAKFTDLGSDVVGLLQSEKQKYDAGKFDDALAKISERIAFLKEQVNSTTSGGKEFLDQLETLDQQKQAIEAQLPGRQGDPPSGGRMMATGNPASPSVSTADLAAQIEALANQTQQLTSRFGK